MSIDTEIGMLIGLAATCVGGLFVMLAMYWMGVREDRPGRGGEAEQEPGPPPPLEPHVEIPDFVPDAWAQEAA